MSYFSVFFYLLLINKKESIDPELKIILTQLPILHNSLKMITNTNT